MEQEQGGVLVGRIRQFSAGQSIPNRSLDLYLKYSIQVYGRYRIPICYSHNVENVIMESL